MNKIKHLHFSVLLSFLSCSQIWAAKLGPEVKIGAGKYTDCAIDAKGDLHIATYDGVHVKYMVRKNSGEISAPQTVPDGSLKNSCNRNYGASVRLMVAKSGAAHLVWGKRGNAFYSNNEGGQWKAASHLPVKPNNCNMHPKVSGGYEDEIYVHSWNYYGGNNLYKVTGVASSKPTINMINQNGGATNRDGSVIGPSSESNLDGNVYWVDGTGGPKICMLKQNGGKSACNGINGTGKAGEGFDLFAAGTGPGIAYRAYHGGKNRESINTLERAKKGKKAIEVGQGYNEHGSFPRAAFCPKENKIYVTFVSEKKKSQISIVDMSNEKVEKLGDVTQKGSLPNLGRGPSGGGLAPHPQGGVHFVYSANGTVYHRIVSTSNNPSGFQKKGPIINEGNGQISNVNYSLDPVGKWVADYRNKTYTILGIQNP